MIERSVAFGTGAHPTTRMCLDLLAALEPGGSLADLGCGAGALAIAAARRGFAPVEAVDRDELSVAAVSAAYARAGMRRREEREDCDWVALVLERDDG